jgi:hypothetical protein
MKLNQVIAVQSGKKTKAKEVLNAAYHQLQKPELLSGLARSYKPKDENGDQLPSEGKLIQVKVSELVNAVTSELASLFDIVLTQDSANCHATADIVVGSRTILKSVPVTYLLFLDKQLVDIRTFIEKMPTLDPSEKWTYDATQDCYASEPSLTSKSKKVPKSHVKYEATPQHPAQVELLYEDVPVGTWTNIKYSSAIPVQQKNKFLARVATLTDAVKLAREEANSLVVKESVGCGIAILDFVFGV